MRKFNYFLFLAILIFFNFNSVSVLAFDPVFKSHVTYQAGYRPLSIACDYFNQDEYMDLAVGCSDINLCILLGNEDGTFNSVCNYLGSCDKNSIITGDFDGDMDVDLAAVYDDGEVQIFKGGGEGSFFAGQTYSVGNDPCAITIGHFNNDWDIDLAVLNNGSNSVSILSGAYKCTFEYAGTVSTAPDPRGMDSGDFDGDGNLDIAISDFDWDNVSILRGNGDFTFSSDVYYRQSYNPGSMVIDDFNNDGYVDLAVINGISQSVAILLGNGDGTLAPAEYYGVGYAPCCITSNDFTNDGYADLAVGNSNGNDVSILEGKGDGTFVPAVNFDLGGTPRDITSGDFDGDGDIDIATANYYSNNVSVLINVAQSVSMVCPRDTVLNSDVSDPEYVLSGFKIFNRGYFPRQYNYSVSSVGPATLDDGGDPASLSGTTPVLERGEFYIPPDARLLIPSIRKAGIQEVSYTVVPTEHPDSSGTGHTVITYEPPIAVTFQSFNAVSRSDGIQLNWIVSSAEEVTRYNIYRSSDGGATFEIIDSAYKTEDNSLEYLDKEAKPGIEYIYKIGAVGSDGEVFSVIQTARLLNLRARLKQNWPNPFNPSTRIEFTLPSAQNICIDIYDVEGKLVRRLINKLASRGENSVEWDGKNDEGERVNSGVYYYRISAGRFSDTKKMILLR